MNKTFYQRDTCRLCGGRDLENVLPLTPTALCDAYVPAERLNVKQEIYPLDLFLCRDCGYVHLPYVVDPEIIYRDYLYVTTSSLGLVDHFKNYAEEVIHKINPDENSLVIDIGSNDGSLLSFFKALGMRVLGVEPATAIARAATNFGVNTLPNFFNCKFADKIRKEYGTASIITFNNLFANIDDLEDIVKGVSKLLAADGVFIIESSYLGDIIKNKVFDFIYHEHLSYFSVKPLLKFLQRFGMKLIDIEQIPTKGGSLRYYFQLESNALTVSSRVYEMLEYEEAVGLDKIEIFKRFSEQINSQKEQLLMILRKIKEEGKTIVGYGASATSTTLIYHFGLDSVLDYIVDDNPAKRNTFSPGHHIPVLPSNVLYEKKPDYVLILAWRYAEPIMDKHKGFLEGGGRFIIPLPEVREITEYVPKEVYYRNLSVNDSDLKRELLEAVERVLSHGRIILGPEVEAFEGKLTQICRKKYAVGVNSGTDALQLALRSLGVGPGDEVITTPLSWIATLNAIVLCGAKPVFVDISEDLNINVDLVEKAITSKTKVILPVHFTGKMCNIEKIIEAAKKHNLYVIEDAAQSFGAHINGKAAGSFADLGCFSMNPMKILHAYGEAGAVVTDDQNLYQKLISLRYAGLVDKEDCHYPGFNARLDTVQAAMLLVNLKYLEDKLQRRRKIAKVYTDALKDIVTCPIDNGSDHIYYSYTIITEKRNQLKEYLTSCGIETKIQHPILMPHQTAYRGLFKIQLPVAERVVGQILCLPNEEGLSLTEVKYVIKCIKDFFESKGKI